MYRLLKRVGHPTGGAAGDEEDEENVGGASSGEQASDASAC
jgi:hypothetical protein